MTADVLDRIAGIRTYEELVAAFPPRLVRGVRALAETHAIIDRLLAIKNPTVDQLEYLELLSAIAEAYEEKTLPIPTRSLGSLLAHLIEAKGVSRAQAARGAGISPATLSGVLADRHSLSLISIRRLADYFSVEAGLFLDASGTTNRRQSTSPARMAR